MHPFRRIGVGPLFACGGVVFTATAEAQPPARAASDAPTEADWKLTNQARQALWDVNAAAAPNLGVRVRAGTATVWGPVAARADMAEIVDRLGKVPGVRTVVSELYVAAAGEPADAGRPRTPAAANAPIFTVLPTLPEPRRREPAAPPPPEPPTHTSASPPSTDLRPRSTDSAAPTLPPVTIPEPELPLIDRVEQVRQRERRFRNLRVEVRGSQVVIQGSVQLARDGWDFAQMVQQVPGVTGVTLRTQTSP